MEFWRVVESDGGFAALGSGGAIAVIELDRMAFVFAEKQTVVARR